MQRKTLLKALGEFGDTPSNQACVAALTCNNVGARHDAELALCRNTVSADWNSLGQAREARDALGTISWVIYCLLFTRRYRPYDPKVTCGG